MQRSFAYFVGDLTVGFLGIFVLIASALTAIDDPREAVAAIGWTFLCVCVLHRR